MMSLLIDDPSRSINATPTLPAEEHARKDDIGGPDYSPLEKRQLGNGAVAWTWTIWERNDLDSSRPHHVREIYFDDPYGRHYDAHYELPQDWKARQRYERIFNSILDSLEFFPQTAS